MSFWKGRESEATRRARLQDHAEQARIKSELTAELSKCVKRLQGEYLVHQGPILSSDTANAICNVIEAIFMHGFKGDLYHKAFWPFLSKFTHKDVVAQISQLSQINSDVGMCRSWIRVAINDGLVESYVDAIIGQPKVTGGVYDPVAYLRDPEHPGIMKSLLSGLMDVEFRLSYNSSLLNDWAQAPFVLSGLTERSATPVPVLTAQPATEGLNDEPDVQRDVQRNLQRDAQRDSRPLIEVSPIAIEKCQTSSSSRRRSQMTSDASPFQAQRLTDETRDSLDASEGKSRASSRASSKAGSAESDESTKRKSKTGKKRNKKVRELKAGAAAAAADAGLRSGSPSSKPSSRSRTPDAAFPPSPPPSPPSTSPIETDAAPSLPISETDPIQVPTSASKGDIDAPKASSASPPLPSPPALLRHEPLPPQMSDAIASPISLSPPKGFAVREMTPRGSVDSAGSTDGAAPVNRERKRDKLKKAFHRSAERLTHLQERAQSATSAVRVDRLRSASMFDVPTSTPVAAAEDADAEAEVTSPGGGCNRLDYRSTHGWSSSFEDAADATPGGVRRKGTQSSFVSLFQEYEDNNSVSNRAASPLLASIVAGLADASATPTSRTNRTASSPEVEWRTSQEEIVCSAGGSSIPDQPASPDDFEIIEKDEINLDAKDMRVGEYLQTIGFIRNERGLDFQDFKCSGPDCGRMIGMIYGKARVCALTGAYYCHECHENDEGVIPARMVQNWDFRKHKVSKFGKNFLTHFDEQPVINVKECNPKIYSKVKVMQNLLDLRTQLLHLKSYLFTCKQSVAEDLRLRIWPNEYLFDMIHFYSPADLRNAHNGSLASRLKKIIDYASKHVYACPLCKQKGFICEICNNEKVIYPFEMTSTWRCEKCTAVYHRDCRPTENDLCVKCERIRRRNLKRGSVGEAELDFPESIDFVVAPDEGDHESTPNEGDNAAELSPELKWKTSNEEIRSREMIDALAETRSDNRSDN